MKKKLIIVLPVVLLAVAGGAYKFVLAPKPAAAAPPKIEGAIVKLPQEFVLNLAGGHYGRVTVALVVPHAAVPAAAHGGATDSSGLEQEAAIRAIVTDQLTGAERSELVARKARHELLERLAKRLRKETDTEVEDVLFTDIAVQ
jgi:flagellar basal body-associated protein FliL